MSKSSNRPAGNAKQSGQPTVTDDGVPLAPVDGKSELGNLKVLPIEPPPLTRARRNSRSVLRREAETTSTPDKNSPPPAKRDDGREAEKKSDDGGSEKNRDSDSRKARVVFGADSRQLYTPTNVFPNRAICHLIVRYPWTPAGRAWSGTGNFIGTRHVLTAGHVLFKASEGGWAQSIRVIPGRDGDTWWFGSENLVWPNFKQRSVTGWTEDSDIDYDYGLITLNTGFNVGSFGLLYAGDSTLESSTAYLIGYPADRGTPAGSQQYGVPSGGGITDVDSTLIYYSMDTFNGQSGAGVYRFWNGVRAIIGVHGGGYDSDENRAARITKARHDLIRSWQAAD